MIDPDAPPRINMERCLLDAEPSVCRDDRSGRNTEAAITQSCVFSRSVVGNLRTVQQIRPSTFLSKGRSSDVEIKLRWGRERRSTPAIVQTRHEQRWGIEKGGNGALPASIADLGSMRDPCRLTVLLVKIGK